MAQTNKSVAYQAAMRERADNGDPGAIKALRQMAHEKKQKAQKKLAAAAGAAVMRETAEIERLRQEEDAAEADRMNKAAALAADHDAITASIPTDAIHPDGPSDLDAAIGIGRIALVMFVIVAVVSLYLGVR